MPLRIIRTPPCLANSDLQIQKYKRQKLAVIKLTLQSHTINAGHNSHSGAGEEGNRSHPFSKDPRSPLRQAVSKHNLNSKIHGVLVCAERSGSRIQRAN